MAAAFYAAHRSGLSRLVRPLPRGGRPRAPPSDEIVVPCPVPVLGGRQILIGMQVRARRVTEFAGCWIFFSVWRFIHYHIF
jgi:hypothetical protein